MKAILQRVTSSSVSINKTVIAEIRQGLNILLGVGREDDESIIPKFVEKLVNLRIFADDEGKMNKSLLDVNGEVLLISQFTLYGDTKKGRRPSFIKSAEPEKGRALYQKVIDALASYGVAVKTGEFGASMDVDIHNDGPVTIILDSDEL
ncbi:MAG: D-tyrosyl-tRNA(Tyr) deacylase [Parcubacteria group bacterium]|nr:D-tyrosyl-tRNA(Tyr) deacylase [Parcubacteria group bacterium]